MTAQSNLAEFCTKKFTSFKNALYKNYGENPGKMLVHTGVLGWILSSAAQVAAVVFNDKISQKEKMFLIPQECADAMVNILSFYVVTNTFKAVGSKLVSTGKLVTPNIRQYLQKAGLEDKVGKITTDIKKGMTGSIRQEYTDFKSGVDVISSTVGSIISCNLITPVLRNKYAAKVQKESLAKKDIQNNSAPDADTNVPYSLKANNLQPFFKPLTMSDYQKNAFSHFSTGSNLKI